MSLLVTECHYMSLLLNPYRLRPVTSVGDGPLVLRNLKTKNVFDSFMVLVLRTEEVETKIVFENTKAFLDECLTLGPLASI